MTDLERVRELRLTDPKMTDCAISLLRFIATSDAEKEIRQIIAAVVDAVSRCDPEWVGAYDDAGDATTLILALLARQAVGDKP